MKHVKHNTKLGKVRLNLVAAQSVVICASISDVKSIMPPVSVVLGVAGAVLVSAAVPVSEVTEMPVLAIEILSQNHTIQEILERFAIYFTAKKVKKVDKNIDTTREI